MADGVKTKIAALDGNEREDHDYKMNEEMKYKINQVLDSVKDPESDLPVSRLGIVERVRYNKVRQEFYIFLNFQSHLPRYLACVGLAAIVINSIKHRLLAEFQQAFPELTIMFV